MIRSFKDKRTEVVFSGRRPKDVPVEVFKRLRHKLLIVDAAHDLEDLRNPPSNRLHTLVEDRAGQHAIRVNDRYRIAFVWTDAGPEQVEFVDYH